jgi:hypothetical protein
VTAERVRQPPSFGRRVFAPVADEYSLACRQVFDASPTRLTIPIINSSRTDLQPRIARYSRGSAPSVNGVDRLPADVGVMCELAIERCPPDTRPGRQSGRSRNRRLLLDTTTRPLVWPFGSRAGTPNGAGLPGTSGVAL